MFRIILNLLQYASISLSGFLGLYSLTRDFKDKVTGKLTREGRVARLALIASLTVGLVAHSIQVLHQRKEEIEASERAAKSAEQTLAIARNIEHIFSSVDVDNIWVKSSGIRIPLDDPLLAEYRARIIKLMSSRVDKSGDASLTNKEFISFMKDGEWARAAKRVFSNNFTIRIWDAKTPVPSCPVFVEARQSKEILPMLTIYAPFGAEFIAFNERGFYMGFEDTKKVFVWRMKGQSVLSIEDFKGAQLVVHTTIYPDEDTPLPSYSAEETKRRVGDDFLSVVRKPDNIRIVLGQAREIQASDFTQRIDSCDGVPYYVSGVKIYPES